MLTIKELYIYPIKSLGGIRLESARLTDRGLQFDRRWMLIDEKKRFLSQREHALMARLQPVITDMGLIITNKQTQDSFQVPFKPLTDEFSEVVIWDDRVQAQLVSSEADQWFSGQLNIDCRLVYMPDQTLRKVDQEYAHHGEITSLSDAYPILMIGQPSLDDLNSRLKQSILMNRFRPNIVFDGGDPYLEDEMEHFRIGSVDFYGVKLCARCNVTTIDQETLETGKEPLKTMSTYRNRNNKIYFGQNVLYHGTGEIRVGDELQIVKRKLSPFRNHGDAGAQRIAEKR